MNENKSVGLAVASMLLGILSLLLGCCFWYISLTTAIIAIVLAAISISKKMGGKGMAIAGLIMGIMSLIPTLIVMITGSSLLARDSLSQSDSKDDTSRNESSIVEEIEDDMSDNESSLVEEIEDDTSDNESSFVDESTIPVTEEQKEAELSVSDIKEAIKDGDYSLVTPEFKELMDSYESFFDEYIDFMKKYSSSEGDFTTMMTEYTEMLNKEIEWVDKIDEIDEKELSPADSAYYLLVTLRVEKKLLESL